MSKTTPDRFPSAEKSHTLYDDVEYREYWEKPQVRRQDALEQHIVSRMLPSSGHRIIDLGCGYGRLAPCYVNRFDQVVLCDGSRSLLRDAGDSLGDRAVLVAADIGRLPFKSGSFDCLLTIRVLQHAADLGDTFKEIGRVTSRGGSVIFSYHNKRNPHRVIRYLRDRNAGNPFTAEEI
jgi:ubiquinone/menaquinone biosynthesis C-methylase UbiE